MATMMRKQIYIEPQQDALLKQWAQETGKSEAEIFREALDNWMTDKQRRQEAQAAWEQVRAFAKEWAAQGPIPGGRTWTREELYKERLNRYDPHTD